ncbi:MAG: DUF86 domain-containing protein [Acidobacteriota bacterium]
MSRDYRLYLDDIESSAEKILEYTRGSSFDEFTRDNKTFDAVVLNLEIIGEAAKHVPDSIRARYPAVDWRRIGGLRDVIAHGYFGLNETVLWDLVQNQVPTLLEQIRQILAKEG